MKFKLKIHLVKVISILCIFFIFSGCENSSSLTDSSELANQATTLINKKITSDTTLTNDKIWTIEGIVSVENGATLGISAGTIIKFKPTVYDTLGNITELSALVISETGKINAAGSLNKPIIFTSTLDNIEVGQKEGTNLSVSEKGKWGGVVICGKSVLADGLSTETLSLMPNSSSYNYGGTNIADNSGIFTYISIRHSGEESSGGLTFAGVGNLTQATNIEIIATKGSGYRFMGGAVNCKKCITSAHSENGIKIEKGYSGTIETFAIIQSEDSDNAIDITGSAAQNASSSEFTLYNGTIVGDTNSSTSKIGSIKQNAKGKIKNIFITKFNNAANKLEVNADANTAVSNNDISFESIELNVNTTTDVNTIIDSVIQSQSSFATSFAAVGANSSHSQGIFPIVFGWTQSESNQLIPAEEIKPTGVDTDSDGMKNELDTDDDNDGVADSIDVDPTDPTKLADTDQDGLPDADDVFATDATIIKTMSDINSLIESGNYETVNDNSPESNIKKLQYIHATLCKYATTSQKDTINKYFYKYAMKATSISDDVLNSTEYLLLIEEYKKILETLVASFTSDSQIAYTYNLFLQEYEALNLQNVSTYDLFLIKHTIWQFCVALYNSDDTLLTNASNYYYELATYLNSKLSTTVFLQGKLIPETLSEANLTATNLLNSFKLTNIYLSMLNAYPNYATYSKDKDLERFTNLIYLSLAKYYKINVLGISSYFTAIESYMSTNNIKTLFNDIESTMQEVKDKEENRVPLQMISKVEKVIQDLATSLGLSTRN